LVFFEPGPEEVHRQAASWFWDREIFEKATCRPSPVVFDDVDGLYAQRDGVRLLKCLTQSEPHKGAQTRSPGNQKSSHPIRIVPD
jgi:hypothetical protein